MTASRVNASNDVPQRLSLGQPVSVASHFVPSNSTSSTSAGNAGGATAVAAASGTTSSGNPSGSVGGVGGNTSSSTSTSLVNPTSLALSLPHSDHSVPISHVDVQALHYLTMEMPRILRNSVRQSARKRAETIAQLRKAGMNADGLATAHASLDEEKEVIKRLEAIGAHAGATFVERLSRDRAPFASTLDVLKFICKELWTAVWEKQVDNLRTNHRGVYVLQDNVFKPLLRLSVPTSDSSANTGNETGRITRLQLAIPTGLIRGALARLNVPSTVVAETNQVPQCTFHIKTTVAPRS